MKKITIIIAVILIFLFLWAVTTMIIADREEAKKLNQPNICIFEAKNFSTDFEDFGNFEKGLNSSIS